MIVRIRVPHPATVQEQRMVEQIAVTFGGRLELFQKLSKQRNVELIDLSDLC